MATPFGREEDSHQSALNSDDESVSSARSRGRRHSPSDSLDEVAWDLNEDGRPKTRRVNPQRLAVRLGPDLVAEMEAYIKPGAKMPSFTIRKDFQERYNVDRRHIYDYFHSRGLRVAKEDKHTNLIRGRAMKLAQAQNQISGFSDVSSPEIPYVSRLKNVSSPKPVGRPAKRSVKSKPAYMRRPSTATSRISKRLPSEGLSMADNSSEPGNTPLTTSSGTDTDWESSPTSPQFTLPSESSDDLGQESNLVSDFLVQPSDFADSLLGSPQLAQSSSLSSLDTLASESLEPLMQLDQDRLLSLGERTELYDLISGSMSPSSHYDLVGSSGTSKQGSLSSARKSGLQTSATPASVADFSMGSYGVQSWLSADPYQSPIDAYFLENRHLGYGLDDGRPDANFDSPIVSAE